MAQKYPFIKAVSLILKIIWYLQWIFLSVIIIVFILIATNSSLININKFNGLHIQFAKIDIHNSDLSDNSKKGIIFKARFDFDLRTTFLALLIFVIAKIFIRGAELKEDYDLTI